MSGFVIVVVLVVVGVVAFLAGFSKNASAPASAPVTPPATVASLPQLVRDELGVWRIPSTGARVETFVREPFFAEAELPGCAPGARATCRSWSDRYVSNQRLAAGHRLHLSTVVCVPNAVYRVLGHPARRQLGTLSVRVNATERHDVNILASMDAFSAVAAIPAAPDHDAPAEVAASRIGRWMRFGPGPADAGPPDALPLSPSPHVEAAAPGVGDVLCAQRAVGLLVFDPPLVVDDNDVFFLERRCNADLDATVTEIPVAVRLCGTVDHP